MAQAHPVELAGLLLEPPRQAFQAGPRSLQGIAALVGEAGDDLTDAGQSFRLQGLLLGLLSCGWCDPSTRWQC